MEFIRLIYRNLRRQLRRTLLTITTVAATTLLYAALRAVPASLDNITHNFSAGLRVVVSNRVGPYGVPARYCDEIRRIPHVVGCAAVNIFYMLYRDPRSAVGLYAVDPEVVKFSADYKIPPSQFQSANSDRRGAFVGHELFEQYHWKLGQEVILHAPGPTGELQMPFHVIGVLPDSRFANNFFLNRQYFIDTLTAWGFKEEVKPAWLAAGVDRAENVGPVIKTIDENFANSDTETLTQTESDSIASALSYFGDIRAIIAGLCAVVLISVLLISANSMAMMVRERLGDIAVMRALGFGQGWVCALLLGEAGAIGLAGGAIGGGLGWWVLGGGMKLGMLTQGLGNIALTRAVAGEAMVVAVVVSLLAAAVPVMAALRISPAMAFRPII